MSAPDIIDIHETERTNRGVDEAVIEALWRGSRKGLEKAILEYRHARDMRLWKKKWQRKRGKL